MCISRRGDAGLVLTAPQLLPDLFLFLSFALVLQLRLHNDVPGFFQHGSSTRTTQRGTNVALW